MLNKRSLFLLVGLFAGLLLLCGLLLGPAGPAMASSPYFISSYQHNIIEFWEFPANTSLFFEIFASPGGASVYSNTLATDGSGRAYFNAYWTFDIKPGYYIVATAGGQTKDLVVANVRYDILDLEADQARGVAPAGSQVIVYVHGQNSYFEASTTTGDDGKWLADFNPDDIVAYRSTKAHILDGDGDVSEAWVPEVDVQNVYDSRISGQSFTSGGTLTVAVYEEDGVTELIEITGVVADSDRGRFEVHGQEHGLALTDDRLVVVTDHTSGEVRQLRLRPLTMDILDYDQDVVQGMAPPGASVEVSSHTERGYLEVVSQAGAGGDWTADFGAQGDDLLPVDTVYARLYENDADVIRTGLVGPMASITEDFVHWSWHMLPLSATIYGPDNSMLFGPEPFVPVDAMGIDTPEHGIDLEPGYRVEIEYGDGRVVDVTLADLAVDVVDRAADRASGRGPVGTAVEVLVWDTEYPYFAGIAIQAEMAAEVGPDGTWEADFGALGSHDIVTGESVVVFLHEADGGVSAAALLNHEPLIEAVDGPDAPAPVNTPVQVSATFDDPDADDPHTATWQWGDGTISAGMVDENAGTVLGSHTYAAAGVYVPQLTLCDSFNACTSAEYRYVVVFDSEGGFVSGGGWIDSPAGAYGPDPTLTGKATFGFVSKYKKGATTPTGNTEFQFRTAFLNFHSTHYDWLLVTGNNVARFKGEGTINGEGSYQFLIWAGDGEPDTFRIRIWQADGTIIYDNDSQRDLGGGSIVVHDG